MNKRTGGLVIAIDGPSGAGKSTIAGMLASRLGYLQIDTGAMYRAVAYLMKNASVDLADDAVVENFCSNVDIRFATLDGVKRVLANGLDVTGLIRTPEISSLTSRVSALKPVREALLVSQREMGRIGGVVLEGRDIGTVVFPDADLKFFLFASPEERGRRRYEELCAKGESVTLQETVNEVIKRDEQDSQRDIAPLRQADDAIPVDSTGLDIDAVLGLMETFVRKKLETGK
jgi:cytidylate kinase